VGGGDERRAGARDEQELVVAARRGPELGGVERLKLEIRGLDGAGERLTAARDVLGGLVAPGWGHVAHSVVWELHDAPEVPRGEGVVDLGCEPARRRGPVRGGLLEHEALVPQPRLDLDGAREREAEDEGRHLKVGVEAPEEALQGRDRVLGVSDRDLDLGAVGLAPGRGGRSRPRRGCRRAGAAR